MNYVETCFMQIYRSNAHRGKPLMVPSSIGQDERFSFSKEQFDSAWDYKKLEDI